MYGERISKKYDELKELQLKKNADYGNSVFERPVLGGEVEDAIAARLSDKINRLANLRNCTGLVGDESFDDTLKDMVGYCVAWLLVRELCAQKPTLYQVRLVNSADLCL